MKIAETTHPAVPSRAAGASEAFLKGLIFATAALTGLSITLYGGLASWISADLGLQHVHSGLAQAAFFAGNLSAVGLARLFLRRFEYRTVWLWALFVTTAGNLATSVPYYPVIALGRFVTGMGLSSTILILTAVIAERWPARRTMYLSLLHATTAAAAAFSLALGRSVAEVVGGWTPTFWLCGGSSLITALMLRFADLSPSHEPAIDSSSATPSTRTPLRWSIGVAAGYVAIEQSLSVFLPVLAETRLGISPAHAAVVGATLWAGVITGRVGSAFISRWLPERSMLAFGGLGMTAAVVGVLLQSNEVMMSCMSFAAGAFGGPLVPVAYSLASQRRTTSRAAAISLTQLGTGMGGLTGPAIAGVTGDALGLNIGLACVGVPLMLAAAGTLVLTIRDRVRRAGAADPISPSLEPVCVPAERAA